MEDFKKLELEQDLMKFKYLAFAMFASKTVNDTVYQLGIDGHSNFAIKKGKAVLKTSQVAAHILDDWLKLDNK